MKDSADQSAFDPHTESTERLSRRRLLSALGVFALAGCQSNAENLAVQHVQLARALVFGSKDGKALTLDEVAKFPYASMSIRVGRRPEQLILLNRYEGQKLLWLSGDGIMLVTRNGRIMQTGGLRNNLTATHFSGADPVLSGLLNVGDRTYAHYRDYAADYGISLEVRSTYKVLGEAPIEVLGTVLPTVLVEERCRMPLLKWRFKNRYWVHPQTQFVWRTEQHFHPDNKPYVLTMLRPARLPD